MGSHPGATVKKTVLDVLLEGDIRLAILLGSVGVDKVLDGLGQPVGFHENVG